MIHTTRGNMAVGVFGPEGPQLGTMQKAPRRLDYIAYDATSETYFGQQVSTLGVIEDGKLVPLETPETVDLSHSGGLAWDVERATVLVASKSGAGTVLFEYSPATGEWSEIGNIGRDDFHGLACDGAQGLIYALDKPRTARVFTNLRAFNRTGAQVAAIDLSTPIPCFDELRPKLQLALADGSLYAMVSYEEPHPRVVPAAIYAIDPASGSVSRTTFNAGTDLASKTWPGWDGGPEPSAPMSADAQGAGVYSNYETPASLVEAQSTELHVVSIMTGDTNYLEWLQKVKKLRAGSDGKGGVAIELELDLDAEVKHPVVELFVDETEKPVTLALVTSQTVIWSIETAPGAKVAKVITYGHPFMPESPVIGIDKGLVEAGGDLDAAFAWELEHSGTGFDAMIATIRERTGLRESSFRGLMRAKAFRIP
jgi:hypothetical protein